MADGTTHRPDRPFGCYGSWGPFVAPPGRGLMSDMQVHSCNLGHDHHGPCVCKCGENNEAPAIVATQEEILAAFGSEDDLDNQEAWMIENLPNQLRSRCCHPSEPWVGGEGGHDHGHTDCYFMNLAADEIERLRAKLASGILMVPADPEGPEMDF